MYFILNCLVEKSIYYFYTLLTCLFSYIVAEDDHRRWQKQAGYVQVHLLGRTNWEKSAKKKKKKVFKQAEKGLWLISKSHYTDCQLSLCNVKNIKKKLVHTALMNHWLVVSTYVDRMSALTTFPHFFFFLATALPGPVLSNEWADFTMYCTSSDTIAAIELSSMPPHLELCRILK